MSRSSKKGPYLNERLIKRLSALKPGDRTIFKTWDRAAVISPEMVGFTVGVHTGKDFVNVLLSEDMVGHRLGEFAPTRKFRRHGGKMAKDQEQSAAVGK
ncbi:MAG: 30S ribosomal protein S19 [Patescibacteria group bacterium]